MKWVYRTNQSTAQSGCLAPAVGEDGTIYAGFFRTFLALTPEGVLKWSYPRTNFTYLTGRGAALAGDGCVFVAPDSAVVKLAADDGSVLWRAENSNSQAGWPVLSPSDVLYYGSYHANVLGYSSDGIRLWSAFNTYLFNFDPALAFDLTIYGSVRFGLLSLSPLGRTNWIFQCESDPLGSPAIDGVEDIYFGTRGGWFYAVRPDGTLKWNRQFGSRLNCSPAINGEGMIHLGDQSGNFYSLRPDGTTNWVLNIGPGAIESSPVIADNGTIYVGCGGHLVAIAGGIPPAQSAWPMYRHDAQHTGRQSGPPAQAPLLTINRTPGNGALEVGLSGEAGRAYTVLSSSNLQHWTAYTNLLSPSNAHAFRLETANDKRFFRGLAH